mgnify:CR=1 FL=1
MIENLLDKLSEIQSAADLLQVDYNEKRAAILATVQEQLDALEAEYKPKLDAAGENANTITQAIKAAVIEQGASVRGAHLQAVYTKGRVSWDSKALEGFSAAHPEILTFRKIGEPSVSIRGVK